MSSEDTIKAGKVLQLALELLEAKDQKRRAQSLVKAQNEEIKRIQSEIDDVLTDNDIEDDLQEVEDSD